VLLLTRHQSKAATWPTAMRLVMEHNPFWSQFHAVMLNNTEMNTYGQCFSRTGLSDSNQISTREGDR